MVCTIGYEGVGIDQFIEYLQEQDVKALVDVRILPLSRKPGFSKKRLSQALEEGGIKYVSLRELGCPKNIRDQYRLDGSWKHYVTSYNKHIQDCRSDDIEQLANQVRSEKSALMCFEADYNYCHRSLITSELNRRFQIPVEHFSFSKIRMAAL